MKYAIKHDCCVLCNLKRLDRLSRMRCTSSWKQMKAQVLPTHSEEAVQVCICRMWELGIHERLMKATIAWTQMIRNPVPFMNRFYKPDSHRWGDTGFSLISPYVGLSPAIKGAWGVWRSACSTRTRRGTEGEWLAIERNTWAWNRNGWSNHNDHSHAICGWKFYIIGPCNSLQSTCQDNRTVHDVMSANMISCTPFVTACMKLWWAVIRRYEVLAGLTWDNIN